jgi:hypothetical protein
MSLNPFSSRPPRHPLSKTWQNVIRVIVGVGFICGGVVFVFIRNIDYVPGDYRGSDAYHIGLGSLTILIGIWALLATRYPRLRGPWRRKDE